MAHELEYIVKDALMMCDKGAAPGFFRPTFNMTTKINGCLVTTKMDKLPIVNIPSFGICSVTQKPCLPVPTEWQKTYRVKVKGMETLLFRSCMQCGLGGKIEFVTSGQIPLPPDALEDIQKMQEEGAKEEEEGWGWLDTLELVPVVGSIVGMVREAKKGNWGMAILNLGFLVADVAGIVSFGTTTAASTAGKAAIKTGVKVAAKSAAKTAAKQVGKSGLKTGTKLFAKGAAKAFKSNINKIIGKASKGKLCVFACFPAGTKVHAESGIRSIEEIKVGDKVWSYNEETGETGLKEVLQTMEREADVTLKLNVGDDVIETTAEHPFYTQDGWKNAADLSVSDTLQTKNGLKKEIDSVEYNYESKKVFNFAVADWQTYFVALLGCLVHNARPCLATIKNCPKFLKRIMKGNYFNYIREQFYARMGGFNEVVLKTGKRLDSYIPGKEIISRKFTQLKEVSEKTAKTYIDELVKKYKPGTMIKDTKRNAEAIERGGKKLSGDMILEVPPQKGEISKEILEHAKNKQVTIRDTNGKIYNP